jgi:hypothetical protein
MVYDDPLIEQFRSLGPRKFSYVEKLMLFPETSEDSGMSLTLEMELLSDTLEAQNLRLSFYGIKDLQIHLSLDYIQFQEIQIVTISDYQWEGLKYQVIHSKPNELSFFCRSFSAKVITDTDREELDQLEGEA